MVPIDVDNVSFKKRAKWLTNGTQEIWEESMNTETLSCEHRYSYLDVKYKNIRTINHPDRCCRQLEFNPAKNIYAYIIISNNKIKLSYKIGILIDESTTDVIDLKIAGVRSSAYCRFGQQVVFFLADGTLLRTRITSSRKETLWLFRNMTTLPRRKVVIRDGYGDAIGHPHSWCRSMQTSDGKHFLCMTSDGYLYIVNWVGSDKLLTIAESVRSFQIFGEMFVIMTRDGKFKLMRLRLKDHVAEYFTIDMKTELAKEFVAVPAEQHLWIFSKDDQIIRYRMPSLPSDSTDALPVSAV